LGVLAARSDTASRIIKPIMDFLQTVPQFVYLIPAVIFFGIGVGPGVVATVMFALAPGVRLTELGIRQVDREMVEAGEAFGSPPMKILREIQIPLAMPSIMAGVNQIIMLSLSMVVIAGMVGTPGLGADVFEATTRLQLGAGFEYGVSVVILAIYLDRITASLSAKSAVSRARRRGLRAGARERTKEDGMRIGRNRVLAAVFACLLVAVTAACGGGGDGQGGGGGGDGGDLTIGYIAWDENIALANLFKAELDQRGFNVELRQLDVAPTWQAVAQGEIDLFQDA